MGEIGHTVQLVTLKQEGENSFFDPELSRGSLISLCGDGDGDDGT